IGKPYEMIASFGRLRGALLLIQCIEDFGKLIRQEGINELPIEDAVDFVGQKETVTDWDWRFSIAPSLLVSRPDLVGNLIRHALNNGPVEITHKPRFDDLSVKPAAQ